MQILQHEPETRSWSDESGHYIECYGIGTKYNEAKWKIAKETGHEEIPRFVGKHFAVIPHLINTPLSQGGGGHYFGLDTRDDLLRGYAANSHGTIQRVKGPYQYNDGTDDYFYNFVIKLRDSKAAAAIMEHGAKTWIPFSVSPHIWPLEGPDHDIRRWEPIGAALVIKGAFGPQAVISKMCQGSSAQCEKSLGAATKCEDTQMAELISSHVSRSGSSSHIMTDKVDASSSPPAAPQETKAEIPAPIQSQSKTLTIEGQTGLLNAPKVVTAEEFAASEKEKEELKKQVTQLLNDKKNTELTSLLGDLAGTTEEKTKTEFVEKWFKKDIDPKILREFYLDIKNVITERRKKASEQDEEVQEEDEPNGKKEQKPKGKAGSSSLPAEPELPTKVTESKAASPQPNRVRDISDFIMSNGGL